MKNTLTILSILLLTLGLAPAQIEGVFKVPATDAITEDLDFLTGRTLTVGSGATFTYSTGASFGGDAAEFRTDISAQTLDADLTAVAALTTTAYGLGVLELADAAAARAYFALIIGTNVQAYSAALDTFSANGSAFYLSRANHTGTQAWSTLTSTPTTLAGYGITDAQGLDSDLTSIAALTTSSYGRDFLTLADAATARTYIALGNVTNDAQTQAAIMPNTPPAAGQIPVGNAGGTAYAPATMSGDATLASTGALTIVADAVTNAKAANMAEATVKGRAAGAGAGDPTDLTADQMMAIAATATNPPALTSELLPLAPLDGYSARLTAAWSPVQRMLSYYHDPLELVREVAGDLEDGIYPAGNSHLVDVGVLDGHAAASTITGKTWYNQVTSATDVTQATEADQPTVSDTTGETVFDGASDYLSHADDAATSMGSGVSFTVMVRFKPDLTGIDTNWKILAAKGGNNGNEEWALHLAGTGGATAALRAQIYDGTTLKTFASQTVADDTWQTAWLWVDITGAVIGLALDGGAGATDSTSVYARDSTEDFRVGVMTNFGALNTSWCFNGSMSHVAVWKRVLSQAERAAIHARLENP